MPIDKMLKICAIIGEEEQQPCDDCISREEAIETLLRADEELVSSETHVGCEVTITRREETER